MTYLLDACALLAVINGESEADKVLDLLKDAKACVADLSMSIVQLLEVYYDQIYFAGEDEARIIVEHILSDPIAIIESTSYPVMYDAGKFKTSYSISLADCIAAATAKSFGMTLVTKDPEFKAAEEAGEVSVLWLG